VKIAPTLPTTMTNKYGGVVMKMEDGVVHSSAVFSVEFLAGRHRIKGTKQ
jgi:hypothetical protein